MGYRTEINRYVHAFDVLANALDADGCEEEGSLVRSVSDNILDIDIMQLRDSGEVEDDWMSWNARTDAAEELKEGDYSACLKDVALSWQFEFTMLSAIVANTVTLAIIFSPIVTVGVVTNATNYSLTMGIDMPQTLNNNLEISNYVFIGIFTIEAIVKIVGFGGIHRYCRNWVNLVDSFVVILSYVELFMLNINLRALRAVRIFRIFKLARKYKPFHDLMTSLMKTCPKMASLSILLIVFMFIATVSGMMFFGGKFPNDRRSNFDNFGIAFVTVFQIMTSEKWSNIVYDGINYGSYWAVLWFLLLHIMLSF